MIAIEFLTVPKVAPVMKYVPLKLSVKSWSPETTKYLDNFSG
jgi:hypothetical protein